MCGLMVDSAENLPRPSAWLACFLALSCSAFLPWPLALGPWPLLAGAVTGFGLRRLMLRRLGGCTGDTLGAGIEIVEAVVLVAAVLA